MIFLLLGLMFWRWRVVMVRMEFVRCWELEKVRLGMVIF